MRKLLSLTQGLLYMSFDLLEREFSNCIKRTPRVQDTLDVILTPELGENNREAFPLWVTHGE